MSDSESVNSLLVEGREEVRGAQYLTFQLAGEQYGVEILRVQEIRGWERVTRVPNAPDYVLGVVNLRGCIVPIFDLRLRLSLPVGEYRKDTVVIVLMIKQAERVLSVGVVVDGVSDVINATSQEIASTPQFGGRIATDWIEGLASAGEQMVMLLDVDRMFTELEESVGAGE